MIRKTKTTKKKVLCNEFMSQFCHILNEVTQMSGLCLSIEAWSGPNQILNLNLTPPYIVLIFSLLLTEWIQKMKYHTRAIINHSQIVTAPLTFIEKIFLYLFFMPQSQSKNNIFWLLTADNDGALTVLKISSIKKSQSIQIL